MGTASQLTYSTGQESHYNVCYTFDVQAQINEKSKSSSHAGWEVIYTPNLKHYTTQTMKIRGKSYSSSPSQFLFYNSLEQHTEVFSPVRSSRSLALVMDPAYLSNLLLELELDAHEVVFDKVSFELTDQIESLLKNIFLLRKSDRASIFSFDCLATSLLIEILKKQPSSCSKKINRELSVGKFPSNIKKAKKVIAQNLTNPNFTLEELAKACGMSKFHLVRTFKEDVGLSPIQYLNHIKIELAMGLLRQEKVKIADVAMELGYQTFSAFNKAFRKQTKISPREFRSNIII